MALGKIFSSELSRFTNRSERILNNNILIQNLNRLITDNSNH